MTIPGRGESRGRARLARVAPGGVAADAEKPWGYVKGDVNYTQLAEQVFLITDAKKQMKNAGWRPPEGAYRKFKVMGREFDPAKSEEYVKSFAIHKVSS